MAMPPILAAAVGNTRSRLGLFENGELHHPVAVSNADEPRFVEALASFGDTAGVHLVVASVNDRLADRLPELAERAGLSPAGEHRVGRDLGIPINHTLDDARTVGHDRLLNALGAYTKAQQACVVIDAGTAVTVDFVDGEGTFHGGVIAPGLGLMLRALHEHTAALPDVPCEPPDPARGPFGKDTAHAMQLGVRNAVVGLVRLQVELFAEAYEAYPQIVATGGDAPGLFEHDEVVEHVVPDLQLIGIHVACVAALAQ